MRIIDWSSYVCSSDRGHLGFDPVPGRRVEAVVPGGLAVVVHVDVDEAGRDEQAIGVELLAAGAVDLPHGGHDAVAHRHVCGAGGGASAVHHAATSDDQVVLGHRSPRSSPICA